MRCLGIYVLSAFLLCLLSCSREGRVIPRDKMMELYGDLFLADQWIALDIDKVKGTDTVYIYEPLFERYGYTSKDYLASVAYYLEDPQRFAEMIDKVQEQLTARSEELDTELTKLEEQRKERKSYPPTPDYMNLPWYPRAASLDFRADSLGVYVVTPQPVDTLYEGINMILTQTSDD